MSTVVTAPNIAVFIDYENIAIGVRDARYDDFDVNLVIQRILDKGKVVVRKAYADFGRYKAAKRPLHEAAFELIEIPHVSLSGKNSADIRMVVDALDLCYTKEHLDMFCLVSGDSDFSPLVSKLRENAKTVIGLGVKNSTSDLLVENCDEFIYYDDLVRSVRGRSRGGRDDRGKRAQPKAAKKDGSAPRENGGSTPPKDPTKDPTKDEESRQERAIEMVLDTIDALFRERDDSIWGSMVKQTLKRKRPNFSESFHGYRSFNQLLEDAKNRGLLELQKDERSGGYLIVSFGPKA